MAGENESGFKWWMRYVIVPLIGGGGVIAILVAKIEHPTQPRAVPIGQDVNLEATEKPRVQNPIELKKTNDASVKRIPARKVQTAEDNQVGSAPANNAAQSTQDGQPKTKFYAYDLINNTVLPGNSLSFPYSQRFSIRWEVPQYSGPGSLMFESITENNDTKQSVGLSGSRSLVCDASDPNAYNSVYLWFQPGGMHPDEMLAYIKYRCTK